jgi:transcriptional regulator with XRE-family HTH domain
MPIDEKLGAVLRKLREDRSWSLSYVGETCGTSGANISKIERGLAKEYNLQLLSKLAEGYGLKLYELFAQVETIAVTQKGVGREERILLDAYHSMSDSQRQTLMSVAMTLRPAI